MHWSQALLLTNSFLESKVHCNALVGWWPQSSNAMRVSRGREKELRGRFINWYINLFSSRAPHCIDLNILPLLHHPSLHLDSDISSHFSTDTSTISLACSPLLWYNAMNWYIVISTKASRAPHWFEILLILHHPSSHLFSLINSSTDTSTISLACSVPVCIGTVQCNELIHQPEPSVLPIALIWNTCTSASPFATSVLTSQWSW